MTDKPWASKGDERRTYVREMFADIAGVYDLQNSLMSGGAHHRWRRRAVRLLELQPGDSALDLCCGTGDFAHELRRAGVSRLAGVDFCKPMLARAKAKIPAVNWVLGDAMRIPMADETVDAITVGWGLRNVPDINLALREMHRVLRPGGRFVVLDMAKPRGPLAAIAQTYFQRLVPLMGALLGKREAYTYLPKSVESFAVREELARMAEAAGFKRVDFYDLSFGMICIHRGVK